MTGENKKDRKKVMIGGRRGTHKVEDGHEQRDEHNENDHKQSQRSPGRDATGQSRYPLNTHRHLGTPLLKTNI